MYQRHPEPGGLTAADVTELLALLAQSVAYNDAEAKKEVARSWAVSGSELQARADGAFSRGMTAGYRNSILAIRAAVATADAVEATISEHQQATP